MNTVAEYFGIYDTLGGRIELAAIMKGGKFLLSYISVLAVWVST